MVYIPNNMRHPVPLIALIFLASCIPTTPPAPNSNPKIKIDSFQGEYRFLSNFYPAEIEFDGLTYPDVEHAYQSAKTTDMAGRRRIAAQPTPADAKRAGESFPPRPDWPQIKFDVMEQCVRYKFTHHPDLAQKLLDTGDAYLEEGNTWHDQIWGVYQGQGQNHLGIILMKIRAELQK
jgi:ribA/ribD-fused uncharacterized protein